jgi:hypothetical protein
MHGTDQMFSFCPLAVCLLGAAMAQLQGKLLAMKMVIACAKNRAGITQAGQETHHFTRSEHTSIAHAIQQHTLKCAALRRKRTRGYGRRRWKYDESVELRHSSTTAGTAPLSTSSMARFTKRH